MAKELRTLLAAGSQPPVRTFAPGCTGCEGHYRTIVRQAMVIISKWPAVFFDLDGLGGIWHRGEAMVDLL